MRAPFLPTEILFQDRFPSERRIGGIGAPSLFLHCRGDQVIPYAEGLRLFSAAPQPKRFVPLAGCAYTEVWTDATRPLILRSFRHWLSRTPPRPRSAAS